jgi:hypothetical protein
MKVVGVRELKDRLSSYSILERVAPDGTAARLLDEDRGER